MFKFIDDMVYFMLMVLVVVVIGLSLWSLIVFTNAGLVTIYEAILLSWAVTSGCYVLVNNCPDVD